MAKKQKRATPKPAPTKRQLSKWQRQMKIRRIVLIVAAVFLTGIISWVAYDIGYGHYRDRVAPLREVVIKVNDTSISMGYYVDMLDFHASTMGPEDYWIDYVAGMVPDAIIEAQVIIQGAEALDIVATDSEIEEEIQQYRRPDGSYWPSEQVLRDMIRAALVWEELEDHFDEQLPETMEQARVQVMLVESGTVAHGVLSKIQAGGNFTILADDFSHHPQLAGDLGWLPEDLMPNPIVADTAFNMTVGEVHGPVHDAIAVKTIGYWLIEVTDTLDEEDGRQVQARAILLGSEAEAGQVRDELVGGNFTELAMQHSQHGSRDDGGELGWLKPGDMGSTAFDEVAFNITPGVVSEPVKDESVQTTGGYWIIEVLDRDEQRVLEGEAREAMVQRELAASFEKWKEEATIENLLDADKQAWAKRELLRRR